MSIKVAPNWRRGLPGHRQFQVQVQELRHAEVSGVPVKGQDSRGFDRPREITILIDAWGFREFWEIKKNVKIGKMSFEHLEVRNAWPPSGILEHLTVTKQAKGPGFRIEQARGQLDRR